MDHTSGLVGVILAMMTAIGGWFALRNKADQTVVTDLKDYADRLEKRLELVEEDVRKCHIERDILRDETAALRSQLIEHQIIPQLHKKNP